MPAAEITGAGISARAGGLFSTIPVFLLPSGEVGLTPEQQAALAKAHDQNTDTAIKRSTGETLTADAIFAGLGGASQTYTHTQSTASATWTINHNLGFRPSIELFDAGGQEFD